MSHNIDWATLSAATLFANGQSLTQGSYKTIAFDPTKSSAAHGISFIRGNLTYDSTDNCVIVGDGISAIEVSANLALQNGQTGESYWGVISINDTVAANRIVSNNGYMTTGQYSMVSMAPATLSVQSGDKIRLLVYTSSSTASVRGENAFTYLTVKQV